MGSDQGAVGEQSLLGLQPPQFDVSRGRGRFGKAWGGEINLLCTFCRGTVSKAIEILYDIKKTPQWGEKREGTPQFEEI